MTYKEFNAVKGVRNDTGPERFGTGDLLYARNIDIDETGKAQRRLGNTVLYAGAAHSAWSADDQAFFVQGGELKRFTAGSAPTSVAAVAGSRVAYTDINGAVYWTDGSVSGVVEHGLNQTWGIAPPDMVIPLGGLGDLPVGTYLCTMTYVTASGVESGAPKSSSITLTSEGTITFSNLSVSPDPRVTLKYIYLTSPNGDVPLLSAIISNSATSVSVSALPNQSMPVRTQFMGPPPAGQLVGHYRGRAYIACGPFLWYSQPYEYSLFDLRSGFIAFGENIQTFAAVTDGVFIGTTKKTIFLAGKGPEEFEEVPISPLGTILGTEVTVSTDAIGMEEIKGSQITGKAVLWASTKGAVLGMDGGLVRDLTANRYIPPRGLAVGGALLKWRDGTPQYVLSLFSQ